MKILFLPKYPKLGASSRLRTYQYLDKWREAGHEAKASSFFTPNYLDRLYAGKRPFILNVGYCYFRRFWVLLFSYRYDLVWIEKEAFPFLPSYAEWLLNKLGKGYVVDYDDAVFHNYDQHSWGLVRYWMGDKIDWVMRNAQMVFVGNPYLGDRALKAGARQIQLLPTVINPDRYQKKEFSKSKKVRIGWIGSPTTLKYLEDLKPAFKALQKKHDFELVIINSKALEWTSQDFEVSWIPWTEETEVASIRSMDIGIMPLSDNLWERGKCAYKLIQYMACGLPVVASPIGMNEVVVTAGENGYLAKEEKEWISYLGMLIEDAALRKKLGDSGYQLVSEKYTLNKNFEIMEAVVKKLKETH